jgi:hypothetical protein
MIKLLELINPKIILLEVKEQTLSEEFTVKDRGLEFLKSRVEALNKKATKYGVPPIQIHVVKEEMVKELHPDLKKMQMSQPMIMPIDKDLIDDPKSWVFVKQYTIKLEGKAPQIEGYEFIARLEHTSEGNFIYTNPKSSVPNLPAEFKTMNQKCDVCKTNRDRNDTFVIKMEKDDITRFPDKKAGDLLVVGRNCLARFMPGKSIASLIVFTQMIENIQDDIKEAIEIDNDPDGEYGGTGGKYYEETDHLLKFIIGTYLHTGRYVSKKQAQADYDAGKSSESTLERALSEMRPNLNRKSQDYPVYSGLISDVGFIKKVEVMMSEFNEWIKTKDFDKMAQEKPDFADFFHNLKLVSDQEYLRRNHFGFYAALFQLFIRDKKEAEKKADADKQMASLPPSPVKFDATLVGKRLRDIAKEAEVKRLAAGGTDEKNIKKAIRGKEWGWEVVVKKITEYEKTQTFGYGDSGVGYRIFFRDDYGNDFLWFASTDVGFQENGKYIIDGTIAGYESINKYSNRPQTRINRVKILKDLQTPITPSVPNQPIS